MIAGLFEGSGEMWNAISIHDLRSVAGIRLGIGILQGIALSLLYGAAQAGAWPAGDGLVFVTLVLIAGFVPLIVIAGLGNMRHRTLIAWTIAATVLLAGLALHDVTRAADDGGWFLWHLVGREHVSGIWPSQNLVLAIIAALFIAQSMIVAGDSDRAVIAAYPLYFATAWKHAVQGALSAAFVALLWLLLRLAAGMFELVGVEFLAALIQQHWFVLPLTTLAFAGALHVTDANPGIVRRTHAMISVMLSRLLPIVTLLVGGCLATLPFIGFAPLWSTRFATGLLLAATAALLVLINAAYDDGLPEHEPPPFVRQAARVAALMLVPLVLIAGDGLTLRVAQYGWTVDRILAAACIIVAAWYAVGYAIAAIRRDAWLRQIGLYNIRAAFVVLAALLALFTPMADPARLSVLDQLARLNSGAVSPEKFDFAYLRFEGARYGAGALEVLKASEQGVVRRRAVAAVALQHRGAGQLLAPTPEELAAHITVFPRGRSLPPSFLRQDWSGFKSWDLPRCLADSGADCDAFLVDLNHNGRDEIVLDDHAQMIVMTADAHGRWSRVGRLVGPSRCQNIREALRAGKFETAPAQWSEIKVGDRRLELVGPFGAADCS